MAHLCALILRGCILSMHSALVNVYYPCQVSLSIQVRQFQAVYSSSCHMHWCAKKGSSFEDKNINVFYNCTTIYVDVHYTAKYILCTYICTCTCKHISTITIVHVEFIGVSSKQ